MKPEAKKQNAVISTCRPTVSQFHPNLIFNPSMTFDLREVRVNAYLGPATNYISTKLLEHG